MAIEQDYIMQLIKEMVKVIKALLSRRKEPEKTQDTNEATDLDEIGKLAVRLADKGCINEGEDLLFSKIDNGNIAHLYLMLTFYEHLNGYSDTFLAEHQYSRGEIAQGILDSARVFHVGEGVLEVLLEQGKDANY